ncbi:MAG: beta strand repeat-containing protein [Janthinobacterium lividum]
MSVTFSNETFGNSDAALGAIINALGVTEFAGTNLTGQAGATNVTVNGTIGAPGSTASVSISSPLLQLTNGVATYVGYNNYTGDVVYYFNVVGTNALTGQAATVGVAVSAEGVPALVGLNATPINASAVSAPLDPNLPGPVFQSASVNGNTLTLAYSEPLSATGPLASAFTVSSGGVADAVNNAVVSGQTVVLTLATPAANGQTVTVAYADPTTGNDVHAIQDLNGIDAASLPTTTITNVTPQAPGPVFQSATVSGNTLTLAYNEALSSNGPLANSFMVSSGGNANTVTNATVSGQTVVLTLATPVVNGQAVSVGYMDPSTGNDPSAVQDVFGNDASSLTATAAVNNTPQAPGPVLQSATVTGSTLTLAYNEALSTTGPAPASFAVMVGGAAANVTAATVSGQTVVLTLGTPVANGQTVSVSYSDPTTGNDVNAVQDTVGNDASTTTTAIAATNNTPQAPGPVLQTASVTGNTLTLAYNEALSPNGPTTGSFAVTVDGAAANVTNASVSGQTVILTLATPVANGQAVSVGYSDPTTGNDVAAVQDSVGNDASSTLTPIAAANVTAQAPGPVLQSAAVTGSTLTLAYNEALSPNGPNVGSFAVTVDGVVANVTAAAVSGQSVVLTLGTPVANGQAVTVGYTDPSANNDVNAVQDTVGNDAATLAPVAATNNTLQAAGPVLQTATVDSNIVTLAYNETLSATGPDPASFAVTVAGQLVTVTGATVSGQNVVLTLSGAATNGQAVTVGYSDPTTGNDVAAVQDSVGNDASSTLSPIAASNITPVVPGPVLQAATVTGNSVVLTYNEALSTAGPTPDAFTVTVDGTTADVTSATVSNSTVTLTLATPVANGQVVTVGYHDPSTSDDPAAVQDPSGHDASSTSTPTTATNNTSQAPGPVLQTATVSGDTLTLAYNETLSTTGPAAGSFAVTVGGAAADVTAAAVSGRTVVLTLGTPVANGQAVTVGYSDPTTGNDVNAVQDTVGNDASTTLTAMTATNNTPQAPGPVLQTATIDGNTLTLAYDETLSTSGPAASSYVVTVDGSLAPASAAAVSGNTVVLTLGTPVANGQAVRVGYMDPTTGNDAAAVQDVVGNDSSSILTPVAVSNITPQAPGPVLQTATVAGNTVTLAYDKLLSATGPATVAFAVTNNGATDNVTAATVSGRAVTLTLATAVGNGQPVTVGYRDPTTGNDIAAVQDTVGNDAATFTPIAATNTTPQAQGPILQTATVTGNSVTLAYNELLSASGPAAGSFAVSANGALDTVTAATVSGQTVTLTLATPVTNGQAVTVGYTDPTTGNDIAAVQDLVGNDASTFTAFAASNATPTSGGTGSGGTGSSGGTGTGSGGTGTGTGGTGTGTGGTGTGGAGTGTGGTGTGGTVTGTGGTGTGTGGTGTGTDGGTQPSGAGTGDTLTTTTDGNTVSSGLPGSGGTATFPGSSGGTTTTNGATTTQNFLQGSAIAYGTGLAQGDVISVDPSAALNFYGGFTITGHTASPSGVTSVAISAVVDGGETKQLGTAAVNADGSYSFVDRVGPHLQGFITATETDGVGGQTSVQSPYSLQAGLAGTGLRAVAQEVLFSPSGDQVIGISNMHRDGTTTVNVEQSGQAFTSHYYEMFDNGGAPSNTFVFSPGFGRDIINQFRVGGDDHDTVSLPSADFANMADVLSHTRNTSVGAVIHDAVSGDAVLLTGVNKAELKANPSDFTLHA